MPEPYDFLRVASMSEEMQRLATEWPLVFLFGLPNDYTAMVAGSYEGRVMELLMNVYPRNKQIVGFDPQDWATEKAVDRLRWYRNWQIEPYGLGVDSGEFQMGEWGTDGCSFVRTGEGTREQGTGLLIQAEKALAPFEQIDLFVMNMEGYEFKLLYYLIETGVIQRIDRLAVQFHPGLYVGANLEDIRAKLSVSHHLLYDHIPQWGYWTRHA